MEMPENEINTSKCTYKIDKIDKQILNELYHEGKQSPVHMTIKSKDKVMSHTGIKNRINNLIDSHILKIQGNVNINALYCQLAFIKIEFKTYDSVYHYIEKYECCPRIFLMCRITGKYHLNIGVLGKNLDDLNNFFNYCLLSYKADINSSEITFASAISKPSFYPLNIFNIDNKQTNCGKNCEACKAFSNDWCIGCDIL